MVDLRSLQFVLPLLEFNLVISIVRFSHKRHFLNIPINLLKINFAMLFKNLNLSIIVKLGFFNLHFIFVHSSLHAKFRHFILIFEQLILKVDIWLQLVFFKLHVVSIIDFFDTLLENEFSFADWVVDISGEDGRFFLFKLSEFGLHIAEEGVRHYFDICDFDGLEPDTPAFDLLFHIFHNLVTDQFALSHDLAKSWVSNYCAYDSGGLRDEVLICGAGVGGRKIFSKTFIRVKRTITRAEDCPNDGTRYLHTLHFGSDLDCVKVDLVNLGGEVCYLVVGLAESFPADSSLFFLAVRTDDKNPLVCIATDIECGSNVKR